MRQRARNRPLEAAPAQTPSPRRRERLRPQADHKPARGPKTLVVGLGSILSVLVLLALLGAWGSGMTFIMLFGDRMSEKLLRQHSEMQDAYEQRLQAYRAEIARLTLEIEQSRFDQTSVEGRVVEMGRRQRQIDARLQALKRLADLVGTSSGSAAPTLTPAPRTPQAPNRISHDAPIPEEQATPLIWRGDERADGPFGGDLIRAQLGAPPMVEQPVGAPSSEIDAFLERMDRVLINAEQVQMQVLASLTRSFDGRIQRTRQAMSTMGLTPDMIVRWRGRDDAVLPNIVLPLSEQQTPFGIQIARARQNFAVLHGFKPLVETLPVSKPTPAEVRYSSGFGYRIHPLLGTRRLHAGIDIAAPVGTPIRAAGSGTILSAGWAGGFGNLVQVDHGNGLITRYAHLSQISVSPRQPVARGEILGLMGSTGASTGSHLHFETRIKGNAVNPACFLLAGEQIGGVPSIPFNCERPPAWTVGDQTEEEDDDS